MDTEKFRNSGAMQSETAKDEFESYAASIASANTSTDDLPPAYGDLTLGKTLFLDARGIALVRLPLPPSQLEIPICNSDGSLAYMSTRNKKCSGDSMLSSPEGEELVTTAYFFGPGRDPVIRLLHSADEKPRDMKMTGKWNSRTQHFVTSNGSEFRWRYVRVLDMEGKETRLVLEKIDSKSCEPERRLAQLVRNDRTRPGGTRKSTAGNGGELVIAPGAEAELNEALIVATCLVMLKKEIDRRRLLQLMVIGGAAGGP